MKIRKFQSGGLAYTPYLGNENIQSNNTSQTSNEGTDTNEIDKEIWKVLSERGVPSDVDAFLKYAKLLNSNSSGLFQSNSNESYNTSKLILLHSLANKIKWNNEYATKAIEHINDEKAGSDVALTNNGQLYVMDKNGELKTMSAKSYYENSDKYQILTNSNILSLRQSSPNLAFNSNIFIDLTNAVSMKSIVEYMKSTIKEFGVRKHSETKDYLTKKTQNAIESGFENILSGESPDGIYKVTTKISSETSISSSEEMAMAAKYLWDTLDSNMQNTLIAHCAAEGLDPSNINNVYNLIITAIQRHTSTSFTNDISVDYDQTASKNAGIGEVARSEQLNELSYAEKVAAGKTTTPVKLNLQSATGRTNIEFLAEPYPLLQHDGKIMSTRNLADVLNNTDISSFIDKNSISFGDTILSPHNLNLVLYDDTSQLHRAYLPYDETVYQMTGLYKPDYDAATRFEEFQKWMMNGDYSLARQKEKARELNLNIEYKNGTWVMPNMKAFLLVTGVSTHRALDISDAWKGYVSDAEGDYFYNLMESATSYNEGMFEGWWGDSDTIYKSIVAMPIMDPTMATVATGTEYVPKSSQTNIQQQNIARQEIRGIKSNF